MAAVAPRELVAASGKSFHSLRSGEESSSSASEPARPVPSRRDTEQILDYYQSEDAGRSYIGATSSYSSESDSHATQHEREPTSIRSTLRPQSIGKDANGEGPVGRTSLESVASSTSGGVQRRTSQRSAGGADKRRLVIVEVDSKHNSASSSRVPRCGTSGSSVQPSSDNLFARRGVDSSRLGGLALVVPPDAEPSSYAGLSPVPASAPATGVLHTGPTKANPSPSGHQRSMSDAQSHKKGLGTKASPRDVGIVGTLGTMLASPSPERSESPSTERRRPTTFDGSCTVGNEDCSGVLTAPVFQTPKSRSPSPLPATEGSQPPVAAHSLSPGGWTISPGPQLTPSIGPEKDIGRPVAGPIVVDFSVSQPIIGRSPHSMPSGLPVTALPTGEPHQYGDRDPPRATGRLPFKPNQSGPSYLHYQPGVHSTAGPLPSPPRHVLTPASTSPPPRPPRLLSPPPSARRVESKKPGRIPYMDGPKTAPVTSLRPPNAVSRGDSDFSITAVSASSSGSDDKSPELSHKTLEEPEPIPKRKELQDKTSTASSSRSGSHVREGAFPASSVFLSHSSSSPPPRNQHHTLDELVAAVGEAVDEKDHMNSVDAPPVIAVEHPHVLKRSHSRPDLKRVDSWVSLSAESLGGGPEDTSPASSYPSSREGSLRVSMINPVSHDGHVVEHRRASLPAPPPGSQRRVHSLPRTPSLMSITRPTRSQASSPSSYPSLPRKAPTSWPEAMNFQDVLAKKSAAERALAYAAKIRELIHEETGLQEWVAFSTRKERREAPPNASVPPTAATSRVFSKHPRHVSRSSMASEVTFPIRSDSYTATDLSPRPTTDMSSPTSPPSSLPYPSLAHGVGIRKRPSRSFTTTNSSSRGLASPASSSRSLGASFLSSIGRKTSMKKERTFPANAPAKLISTRQTAPQPRPIKIGATPTIPGGPRAPPRSAQRVNSVLPSPMEQSRPPPRSAQRVNSVLPSPMEQSRPEPQSFSLPTRPNEDLKESFDLQVEKLSDLLPQADKKILAGYLRRAVNEDPMLAIGAYLEDEKQGSLRSD